MKPPRKPQVRAGEVEYKQTSGTAWSHSYLNQKPWHPLSYPNQRRKWIAEQTHANQDRKKAEVAKEFSQEQEFFQQTSALSKKQKEKVEVMQAVSFMYMRPPGYNAESARAAEIADERKKLGLLPPAPQSSSQGDAGAAETEGNTKRQRVRDVFGMSVATEEEFDVLKNAPRMDTGAPGRVKPFGVEIRNVKCARCGAFGHQSGDRDCPMKDVIMPSEEARLARDDPLNVIMAQTGCEPLKWELKQLPGGLSPARGGFRPDDPNQQIIPTDIFDEYGGFLGGAAVPDVLALVSSDRRKKREKRRERREGKRKRELKHSEEVHWKKRKRTEEQSGGSESSDSDRVGTKWHKLRRSDSAPSRREQTGAMKDDKDVRRKQRRRANLSSSDSYDTSRSGKDDGENERNARHRERNARNRDGVYRNRQTEKRRRDWNSDHSNSTGDSDDNKRSSKEKKKKHKASESSSSSDRLDDYCHSRSPRHKDLRVSRGTRSGRDRIISQEDHSPDTKVLLRSTRYPSAEPRHGADLIGDNDTARKGQATVGHQSDHLILDEYDRWDGGEGRCDPPRQQQHSSRSESRGYDSEGQGQHPWGNRSMDGSRRSDGRKESRTAKSRRREERARDHRVLDRGS